MLVAESLSLKDHITNLLIDIAWHQWADLGANIEVQDTLFTGSVIDLEALVLSTICLQEFEPRLTDILYAWATENSRYLSVQRFETIAKRFPEMPLLGAFKRICIRAGDKRWGKRHESLDETPIDFREGKLRKGKSNLLVKPTQAWLRARIAFGVSAKTDVICLFEANARQAFRISEAAFLLGYSQPTIRQCVQDLAKAGLLRAWTQRDLQYQWANQPLWHFQNMQSVSWKCFSYHVPLLLHGLNALNKSWETEYLQSREVRNLYEAHVFDSVFAFDGLTLFPNPSYYEGAQYNTAFEAGLNTLLQQLSCWSMNNNQ